MEHKLIKLVTITLCFLIASTLLWTYSSNNWHSAKGASVIAQATPDPVINVTFRLLAIEAYYNNGGMKDGNPAAGVDEPMKSAQYLIANLRNYNNWQNSSDTSSGFRYISHIHLLSADPNASTNFPSYYKGTPTKGNVTYEIQHFLANTSAGETNNYTIRILYYVGHSDLEAWQPTWQYQPGGVPGAPWLRPGSFYLLLGKRVPNSHNASDPLDPTDYQELWGHDLNDLLDTGDLRTNNCTLVMLDSCHSGAAIQELNETGRVILTSCSVQDLSYGWLNPPKVNTADHWSWFTGQNSTNSYFNDTQQTPWPGGIGIIGAIRAKADPDQNGWATADEIFDNLAPWNSSTKGTTYNYSRLETENNSPYGNPSQLPAENQTPQMGSGVLGAFVPLVQYNASKAFPYNGFNYTTQGGGFEGPLPQPYGGWQNLRFDPPGTGFTESGGPSTGHVLWAKSGFDVNASVIVSSWEAVVATKDGVVHGVELTTGNENWKFNAGSQIIASPVTECDKHTIFVGTLGGGGGGGGAGGWLYALNEPTGKVLWEWEAPTGVGFFASPVLADGRVYVATYSQTSTNVGVYAFNQTSKTLLATPLWAQLTLGSPIKSSPAVKDGRVYVATTNRTSPARLCALSESSGGVLWSYSFGLSNVVSSPAVAAGKVFIGCMGGGGGGGAGAGLYAFPESGSTPSWEYPTSSPVSSSPAVDEKKGIVVGCSEGGGGGGGGAVFALALTGSPIWSSPPESVKMSSPGISGNSLVYVGSVLAAPLYGQLLCINETTGAIVWSYVTGSPVTSSPAITEDHVLVGTTGSTLYNFGYTYPDIAVTNVNPSKTHIVEGAIINARTHAVKGGILNVSVTVRNNGDLAQTFGVTLYSGPYCPRYAISTLQVTLAGRTSTTLTFGVDPCAGFYVFGAYAWPVNYESNTLNNFCFGNGTLLVSPSPFSGGHSYRNTAPI